MVASKATALSLAASVLSIASHADAFWRMPCRSRTGLARIDPLMNPGEASDHVHAIHGGGNFGFSTTSSDLVSSSCTSCEVTQDKSAYWTPSLHFMYTNGTTVLVPQVGGMLAYYLLYTDASDATGTITAFPEGFAMISGDKRQRNFTWPVPDPPKSDWSGDQVGQFALQQKALGFNCLNYNAAPEPSLYRHFMPDKTYLDGNCLDGLRLELMFPSCWNGVDLTSDNYRSHVAFPDLVMTGTCPDGFKTKVPSLFYETIWDTYAFAGIDGEFVLSTGDPTGYGYHGDFMMGWDSSDLLQEAVDTCTNLSGEIQDCALFDIQSDDTAAQCTFDVPSEIADDEAAGPRDGLAIDVPIQSGPAYATTYAVVLADDQTAMPVTTTAANADSATTSTRAIVPTLTFTKVPVTDSLLSNGAVVVATEDTEPSSPVSSFIMSATTTTRDPTTASTTSASAATTSSSEDSDYDSDAQMVQVGADATVMEGSEDQDTTDASASAGANKAAHVSHTITITSAPTSTTASPSTSVAAGSADSPALNAVATSITTQGDQVIELVIEVVEVTVTVTDSTSNVVVTATTTGEEGGVTQTVTSVVVTTLSVTGPTPQVERRETGVERRDGERKEKHLAAHAAHRVGEKRRGHRRFGA